MEHEAWMWIGKVLTCWLRRPTFQCLGVDNAKFYQSYGYYLPILSPRGGTDYTAHQNSWQTKSLEYLFCLPTLYMR